MVDEAVKLVSLVVPLFNEAEGRDAFRAAVLPCLDAVADNANLLAEGKPEAFMTKIALSTGDQKNGL